MQYVRLGASDLTVSRICLGTVFRSEMDEATCLAAIAAAADLGVNYLDGANVYRHGYSEQVVGKAIRGRRERFIVSTKVGAAIEGRPGSGGLSRASLLESVDASLGRLGTDYLDCLLCHFPDPHTPLDETLAAMDHLVRQGKIRYPGCSNFEPWRLEEALGISRARRWATFVCNQVLFSLLNRGIEDELVACCQAEGVAITVYATTAIGLLSGRYRYGQPPPPGTSWFKGPYNYRAAMTPQVDQIVQVLIDIARQRNKTPTQVAMAWCLSRPGIDVVITGADTAERVSENCGAVGWELSDAEKSRLDAVSHGQRLVIRKDCPRGYEDQPSAQHP